jgi:CRISPR-associated protein Cas1
VARTAYVVQRGATVRREGALLNVFVGSKREAQISTHDLGQLVLMGNVLLTPGALDLLLERGVDTVLLTVHGRYRARIVGTGSGHVTLRLAQYAAFSEPSRALEVAKALVRGKVENQRRYLVRQAREGRAAGCRRACLSMRATLERLARAETLDEVRGCEGAAAAAYFRVFGGLITAEGFSFDGRNRRPPMDPVNAMLSFSYTLLANVVEAAVHVVGLDPYLGTLHAPEPGRPSLVCDLQEEFRTPLVDAMVVAAMNLGVVEPGDFEQGAAGEPVWMKREAVRSLVQLFERRLARAVRYEPVGKRLPYRMVVEQQVRRMARAVLEGQPYEAFKPR